MDAASGVKGPVYNRPDDIPDQIIVDLFNQATVVDFSARPFNTVQYRSIGFGDLGWWIPLTRVLPLVGITPTMLRDAFNPRVKVVKRRGPAGWSWWGINKRCHKTVAVDLPAEIASYDELGSFPLAIQPFHALSRIMNKTIKVWREAGGTGDHTWIFTVHPDGRVEMA